MSDKAVGTAKSTVESGKPRRLGRGLSSLLQAAPAVEVPVAVDGGSTIEGATERLSDFTSIGVDMISASRYQPRTRMDDAAIAGLSASIRRSGLMQPVIVRAVGGGRYELIAGERRWRAARLAGLTHVPALVRALSDEEAAEWGLVENVQREDLNPMDRAVAMKNVSERFGVAHAELASRLGLDRSSVANLIRLTELEAEIAELISSGALGGGHGKALLSVSAGAARVSLAKQAAAGGWSVRRLEHEAKFSSTKKPATVRSEVGAREAVVRDMEKRIAEQLGTRVMIRTDAKGTRGKIVISFFGLDQFDGLLSKLGVRES